MNWILLVEFSYSLAAIRAEILEPLGRAIKVVVGSTNAVNCKVESRSISLIIIGHGAPWAERRELIKCLQQRMPGVPIVALLRKSDSDFPEVTFNCPADNPPKWINMVRQALGGIQ
jgi:DNA-binding NarL/FixJ family response regulator